MPRSARKAGRRRIFRRARKTLALILRRIRQQRDQVVIPIGATLCIIAETLERQLSNSPALLPAQLVLGRRPQKLRRSHPFIIEARWALPQSIQQPAGRRPQYTDLIQAIIFQRSSSVLITSPKCGIGPTTASEPFRR